MEEQKKTNGVKAAAPAPAKQQVEPAQTGDKKKKQSKPESVAPAAAPVKVQQPTAPAKAQQPAAKANATTSAKKPAAAAVNVEAKSAPAVNADNDAVVDQEDDGQWVTQGGKQVRCGEELSLFVSFSSII